MTGKPQVSYCADVARERGEVLVHNPAGFDYLPETCCSSCHEDGDRFDVELIDGRTASVCCWQVAEMRDAGHAAGESHG